MTDLANRLAARPNWLIATVLASPIASSLIAGLLP